MSKSNLLTKLGSAAKEAVGSGLNIKHVLLSSILPDPTQPRKTFDSESIASLAGSLIQYGQQYPLICIYRDGKYFLIDGERRFRAMQQNGAEKAAVLLRDEMSTEQNSLIQLVMNTERDQISPSEQAVFLAKLQKKEGLTNRRISEGLGYPEGTVSKLITVGKFLMGSGKEVEDIQAKIAGGEINGLSPLYAAIIAVKEGTDLRSKPIGNGKQTNKGASPSPVLTRKNIEKARREKGGVKIRAGNNKEGRGEAERSEFAAGEVAVFVGKDCLIEHAGVRYRVTNVSEDKGKLVVKAGKSN